MMSPADSPAATPPALKLSAAIPTLCLVLIVAGPLLMLLVSMFSPEVVTEGLGVTPTDEDAADSAFGLYERLVIIVVPLIPIAFATYGLVRARRCFRSFGRGEFFTADVVGNLRGFAAGIALWVVGGWLSTPLMSLLLTLGGEEKRVTVEFGFSGFMTLLFAGIVWQIADVMRRAAAIAEENAQFV